MKRAVLVAAIAALALSAADARAVAPGFDLFQTDPEQNIFKFADRYAIPAGFFAPDSQPFEGFVNFGGEPIVGFQGHGVGNADTVVQRTAEATPGPNGTPGDAAPIELRQLSLVGIAPIEVVTSQSTQLWDVRATLSPSRPSTGSIRLTQSAPNGGTLDSTITVYPKFTFTRLSDGATKELDVGALPDGQRPDDPITGQGTPWRTGCIAPALSVPALNAGFCGGQPPAGGRPVTIEQGPGLQHGIRPASAALEDFACYSAPAGRGFKQQSVTLSDQFARRRAATTGGVSICNPFSNNPDRPVVNKGDHLRCYRTGVGQPLGISVLLRTQFGPFAAVVRNPRRLCVPSTKKIVRGRTLPRHPRRTFRVDHFQCYSIRPAGDFPSQPVVVRDQFGRRTFKVAEPSLLCAPVRKNGSVIRNPVEHLVCYPALPPRNVSRRVSIRNQFGREVTSTRRLTEACVPALKVIRKL